MNVLLITPFPYKNDQSYNVNVDAVISRHSGAKSKNGVFYPLGLAYIASTLEQNEISFSLLDVVPQKISPEILQQKTEQSNIIVLPVSSTRFDDTKNYLLDNKDKIRIGISNFASIYHEKIINEDICDIVVHGEVEQTILDIAKAYKLDKEPDLNAIDGISFKNNIGFATKTKSRPLNTDLDTIPFPYRDGLDQGSYSDIAFLGAPTAFILTARGCPYKCSFCSTHLTYNYKVNYRSPANVVDEIEEVKNKYGINNFYFIDDTFTLRPKRVEEICQQIIDRKLNIKFACLGRIDVISNKMLTIMKKAGCVDIRFGIESGNDYILENVKKNLKVADIHKGIKLMDDHNMRYSLFFMLGNPGENIKTIHDTIKLAKKLNPLFASFNIATPLPGSELFNKNKSHFSFEDIQSFDTISSNFSLCEVPIKTLRRLLLYAYVTFYFRIGFVTRIFREIFSEPKNALKILSFLYRQASVIVGR